MAAPRAVLQPAFARGGDGPQVSGDAGTAADIRAALGAVEVELRAEAGALEVPIERVLALAPGDVIPLSNATQGVALYAGDQLVGRGRPGRSGARRAVQLGGGLA